MRANRGADIERDFAAATEGRFHELGLSLNEALGSVFLSEVDVVETQSYLRVEVERVLVEREDRFSDRRERTAFADSTLRERGQVVQTNDHVLGGQGHRATVRRLEDVVAGEHKNASFSLCLNRQRKVNSHLVTVEVSVERSTDEGVKLNSLTLNELRFECLDTQTVQCWCTVQQHGALANDLFEYVPHLRTCTLNHALGALDVLCVAQVDQALDNKRLEQLESHLLGKTTLVQLELRSNDDHRTTGVVNALSEQVLAETTLLTLEHVAQGLEGTVASSGDGATTTTVVEQCVNGFLKHALLVVDDDLGSTEVKETTQTVVAVDHTTVEVVEVGGRETATIQLNHRAQLRRNNRNNVEHHCGRRVAGLQERVDYTQALDGADLLLTLAVSDLVVQLHALVLRGRRLQDAS